MNIKADYYHPWETDKHITAFRLLINNDQSDVLADRIIIINVGKFQFYMEQMVTLG